MLIIRDLTFSYGERRVFHHFDAQIPERAFCIAPNGAGKTTLLQLVAGILVPETGSVSLDDVPERTASILLSEEILFPEISIARHFRWISSFVSEEVVRERMAPFALEPWLSRTPGELSEGQKHWVALAFACCMPADIYLLDEPFRALDGEKIQLFCDILRNRSDRFLLTAHEIPANCPLDVFRW